MKIGKFIVLYGANNLGKTTQLDLLEGLWRERGKKYQRIKYPIYSLEPTGPLINAVLRQGRIITEEELQKAYAQNRREYQPQLVEMLNQGVDVIAEDYVGTGLAWGLVKGLQRKFLDEINKELVRPDVAVCLTGIRFDTGIEKGHRHERAGREVWEWSKKVHENLALELGWDMVDANGSKEEVHQRIKAILEKKMVI